ncbi:winged helix-turn-helix domain-containing protein [Serratia fonticola]|uniref:winged helix-turn-helix domain-containing protein n=1 Tax=Serratia fonticola TaxID=47917 RepID=UPI001576F8B3|nr:helix-turn-helix domain-containing protein [Serratia fonticola]NTY85625.1 winged helix-turn-helix domain-containing protein [Serratia fonticola]NTZ11532.1 winged helix-turn-helix domain-containing protein [Serratia fonticola]
MQNDETDMHMDDRIYGFVLDENTLFKIDTRKILFYSEDNFDQSIFFKAISLNETQARLLIYLLTYRHNIVINKNDILKGVWDEFDMSSSNQRLWQTVNILRRKLKSAGLAYDLISNERGHGYSIDGGRIKVLHIY